MHFKRWLLLQEAAGRPGAKQGLYPPLAHQAEHYPPADVITWAADAITYMPREDRRLEFKWGQGMLANPNQGTPLNFGSDDTGDGLLKFKWGTGVLAKPKGVVPLNKLKEAFSYWDGQKDVKTNIIILWKDEFASRPKLQGKVGGMLWDMPMKNANAGHGTAYYIEASTKDEALLLIEKAEPHPRLKNVFYYGPGAKEAVKA